MAPMMPFKVFPVMKFKCRVGQNLLQSIHVNMLNSWIYLQFANLCPTTISIKWGTQGRLWSRMCTADIRDISWRHLVVPYTEELISRLFLGENSIWQLFWDHVDPWPATVCFFPPSVTFVLVFTDWPSHRGLGWQGILWWICLQNA